MLANIFPSFFYFHGVGQHVRGHRKPGQTCSRTCSPTMFANNVRRFAAHLIPRLVLVQALKFYETPQVRASDFANDLAVRQSRVGYDKSIIILCRFCNPTTMSKVENTIRAKLIGEIVTNYRELIHVKF